MIKYLSRIDNFDLMMKKVIKFIKKRIIYLVFIFIIFLEVFVLNFFFAKKFVAFLRNPFNKKKLVFPSDTLAYIFNTPITSRELDVEVFNFLKSRGRNIDNVSRSELKSIKLISLNKLIDKKIISKAVLDNPLDDIKNSEFKKYKLIAQEQLESYMSSLPEINELSEILVKNNTNLQNLQKNYLSSLFEAYWLNKKINQSLVVTEEEKKKWYDEHKKDLYLPLRIRISHIFLPIQDMGEKIENAKNKIYKIYNILLEDPLKFSEISNKYSKDKNSAREGGDLGYVHSHNCPQKVRSIYNIGRDLQINEISEPILTQVGWHIIKITDKKKRRNIKYDEIKNDIEDFLFWDRVNNDDKSNNLRSAIGAIKQSLINRYPVKFIDKNLNKYLYSVLK